jgi:hypothetical protein
MIENGGRRRRQSTRIGPEEAVRPRRCRGTGGQLAAPLAALSARTIAFMFLLEQQIPGDGRRARLALAVASHDRGSVPALEPELDLPGHDLVAVGAAQHGVDRGAAAGVAQLDARSTVDPPPVSPIH